MEDLVLVGFGGHARSVADSIERLNAYNIVGYTDLQASSQDNGYKYLGSDEILGKLYKEGVHKAFVSLGQLENPAARVRLYNMLKEIGYELPVIIDPSAILASNVDIGEGSFVGKGAILNSNASIGKMCIINTGAICEHDNRIADFVHIAVGAVCLGNVSVDEGCLIGANATIMQGISIGANSIIGAGSTVLHKVAANEKRYGIV